MVEGLQLAARFVLPAYRNGSCGTGELPDEQIVKCITKGNCKGVRNEFTKLATMYPYLKIIRNILGYSSPFHPDVIRAYWLGSDNLHKAEPKHFELLLSELVAKGFPREYLDEVKKIAPANFIPIHLYQVLLSHFLSGGTRKSLEGVNNCMVRSGVITEISGEKAKVDLVSLASKKKELVLTTLAEEVVFDTKLLKPALKVGNKVAVHLKWVAVNLTETPVDAVNLLNWTKEVLKAYNS